jgi:hypothetical protein
MENATATHLLDLAAAFGAHTNKSHWRVSFLARGDGQFFKRLAEGKSCTLKTAAAVMDWFDANWPADLTWPKHIVRPSAASKLPRGRRAA